MVDDSYIWEFVTWLLDGFEIYFETIGAPELYPPVVASVITIVISILLGGLVQMFTSLLGAMFGMQRGRRR